MFRGFNSVSWSLGFLRNFMSIPEEFENFQGGVVLYFMDLFLWAPAVFQGFSTDFWGVPGGFRSSPGGFGVAGVFKEFQKDQVRCKR